MHIRTISAILMLSLGLPAAAEFVTVELAYEVPLNFFRVPASSNGAVTFKECDDCESFVANVTANTQFMVNGKTVSLKDFRKSIFNIRDREAETVIVRRDLKSNTITAIKVTL